MNVFLFDASVLVDFFLNNPPKDHRPVKQRMSKLFASKLPGLGPVFHVPNFCMAECSKAFSDIFIDGTESGESRYRSHVDALLDLVSSKRRHVVQTYGLRREHLVDIEDVFLADKRLPLRAKEHYLSGLDGLIVAMARTLKASYKGKADVYILTAERRMARVCEHYHQIFPRAICLMDKEIPGT